MIKLKLQNVIIVQKRMVIVMKVIGIDPAPSKKTVIYNDIDGFTEIEADKLKKYLDDEFKNSEEDILICWDAPLTGMATEDAIHNFQQYLEALAKFKKKKKPKWSPLEARIIEKYIALQDPTTIPKGISTLPYTGCSHWAITQHCFGLPLINDEFKPPETLKTFKLITSQNELEKLSSNKKNIVEVHPALALWLWLKDNVNVKDWNYKGGKEKKKKNSEDPKKIVQKLTIELNSCLRIKTEVNIEKDDYLDAYVAWLLGTLWLKEKVILVGNKNTGAMLLPKVEYAITLQENLEKLNKITPLL